MTLIIRRRPKKVDKTWVQKDEQGFVIASGRSTISEKDTRGLDLFDSEFDAQVANPVLAQVEAGIQVHSSFNVKWKAYNKAVIYTKKYEDVKKYRASQQIVDGPLEISSLLQREADARGISVEALVTMIEAKAFADQAMEDAEIERIVEKVALPT